MRNPTKYIFQAFIPAIALFGLSCSSASSGDEAPALSLSDVAVAGYYTNAVGTYPCYWKNGAAVALGAPGSALDCRAESIAEIGGDIYVDCNYDAHRFGGYWKNGAFTSLSPDTAYLSKANNMRVFNGSLYLAGQYDQAPAYWVDGARHDCPKPDGAAAANLNDIAMLGTDVYGVGSSDDMPYYWKNDAPTPLAVPAEYNGGYASAAVAYNGHVYIVGDVKKDTTYYPCSWVDGSFKVLEIPASSLATEADAQAIRVVGSTVYICAEGYYTNASGAMVSVPLVWKDGIAEALETPKDAANGAWAYSVGESGGQAYFTGASKNGTVKTPCAWLNGTYTPLPLPAGANSAGTYGAESKRQN